MNPIIIFLCRNKRKQVLTQAVSFLAVMKIRKKVSRSAEEAPPSSAQIVASIDDLLTEILLRLPIRSLLRFRLVSHHWHSLLLTQQFDPLLNPLPNPAIGLIFPSSMDDLSYTYTYTHTPFSLKNSRKDPPFRKLNFAPEPTGIQILQSCNGLLLCSSDRENDCNRKYSSTIQPPRNCQHFQK